MGNFTQTDTALMRRALHLATLGEGRVSPNPMVGAVIWAEGRIIGEGYHRQYGGPHAEPNAIGSVKEEDRELLKEATMYVTLEPCSHYGKTPPCADLIIENGIPRVVVASADPFHKVGGTGIKRLRESGIEVDLGLLDRENRILNRRFFTAHTLGRPYIMLKWAETADRIMGTAVPVRLIISNALSEVGMHKERSRYDAIMVGTDTVVKDAPRLSCRLWPGREGSYPRKVTFDSPRLPSGFRSGDQDWILKSPEESLEDFMRRLYGEHGITSLMVEGGSKTLTSFLDAGLVDEIRIEQSSEAEGRGIKAPDYIRALDRGGLEALPPEECRGNFIYRFVKNY